MTLISVGALYMHVTLFSRLTAKNNMKGSIGTTIVAIENRQDVFAPLFSFFLCFFFSSLLAPISGQEKWWAGAAINHGIVDVDDGY